MSAVPGYLTAQSRWLLWRTQTKIDRKTGETRITKVPISFHTGKPCDVTAPASWADHAAVEAALGRTPGAWDGPGFALGVIEPIGARPIVHKHIAHLVCREPDAGDDQQAPPKCLATKLTILEGLLEI